MDFEVGRICGGTLDSSFDIDSTCFLPASARTTTGPDREAIVA